MSGTVAPSPYFHGYDGNGDPIASGKLYTFAAGTTTPLATYSDSALTTPNANPVILDSAGRATVFLSATSYKFVLKTSADVTVWTQDGVTAVPVLSANVDVDGVAGEALTAGQCVYLSDGSGGGTAGRWYKADADNTYSSSAAVAVGFALNDIASTATGSIRTAGRVTGLSGLTAGLTYYVSATAGAVTSSAPTNIKQVGVADGTTSMILSAAPLEASATQAGIVNLAAQTLGAGLKTFSEAPLGLARVAAASADLTKNANTTLANVTGLAFSVAASETLVFAFVCFCKSSDAADYRFALTGPATPTSVQYGAIGTGVGDIPALSAATSFGSAVATIGATGTRQCVVVAGRLVNGANAGTVQLQAAQYASDATDTIIYAGSFVVAFRTA